MKDDRMAGFELAEAQTTGWSLPRGAHAPVLVARVTEDDIEKKWKHVTSVWVDHRGIRRLYEAETAINSAPLWWVDNGSNDARSLRRTIADRFNERIGNQQIGEVEDNVGGAYSTWPIFPRAVFHEGSGLVTVEAHYKAGGQEYKLDERLQPRFWP